MIVYSMIIIPWRISYGQDASGAMLVFDHIVDIVFAVDILVTFNAAYFEEVCIALALFRVERCLLKAKCGICISPLSTVLPRGRGDTIDCMGRQLLPIH